MKFLLGIFLAFTVNNMVLAQDGEMAAGAFVAGAVVGDEVRALKVCESVCGKGNVQASTHIGNLQKSSDKDPKKCQCKGD